MTTPRPALAPAGRGPAWEAILGRVPAPVWPAAAGVAVAVSVHVLIGVAGTRDAWLFVAGVVAVKLGERDVAGAEPDVTASTTPLPDHLRAGR